MEMKAGSAIDVEVFRCDARGASIASGSDMPKSSRSSRICSTVVMIVEPPGLPTPSNGRPSWSTIVGAMLERGRLPPTGRFGSSGGPRRVEVGELVVEKEAVAGHGDPAARELLDGRRVRDDVAVAVDDGQVVGREALGALRHAHRGAGAGGVGRDHVAGRDGCR